VAGELCIAGDSLARGYLNHPDLTAERFINQGLFLKKPPLDPAKTFDKKAILTRNTNTNTLYRTGDLARWLPDGSIEFLGRIDFQIKIRGYRIELSEIETQLLAIKGIKEAVAVDRENKTGEKYLCAYIVSEEKIEPMGIKVALSQKLPGYMIPSYFMQIEKIPLTPNGKINRKALPQPEFKAGEYHEAPANPVEEKLAEIWSEVLGIEKNAIDIHTSFFDLGGHSLKATILITRIHKEFNVKITLGDMFRKPFIRGLAELIGEAGGDIFTAVEPIEKKEYYPLSAAQKRIYILQQMKTDNISYNNPAVLALEGNLDRKKFAEAIQQLIRRHETLRTSFEMLNQEPVQKVHEDVEFVIDYSDLAAKDAKNHEEIVKNFIRAFDLSKAPLMRVEIIKTGEKQHIIMVDLHHIITDGTSMQVFIREFLALYGGTQLPPLRIQYKDFLEWQNSLFETGETRKQQEYWRKQLEGEIPVLNIPTDYPRSEIQRFEGDTVKFEIGSETTRVLKKRAKEQNATLYMVLLAVYNVLLSKLCGQEDIIIGAPTAGRRHADLHLIIGMFINTLVMRNYPTGQKTFKEFLDEVKERTLAAFENQDYPFDELVDQIAVTRDTSRNPLFDVMFVLQNVAVQAGTIPEAQIPGLAIAPYQPKTQLNVSKFDMTLVAVESGDRLLFTYEYCTSLFRKETIKRFITYFERIVEDICRDMDKKISDIDIISPEEKDCLLKEFNQTEFDYPEDKTIHELFAKQVEKTPERLAIVGSWQLAVGNKKIEEPVQLTYNELNRKADQVAQVLKERGVLTDSIVGIKMERSVEMIIGILGILKAGGAYLPIDPQYPQERIDYMLKDSGAKLLVTTNNLEAPDFPLLPATGNRQPAAPLSLAYIIFTSGSTGKPKGVGISHANLSPLLHWGYRKLGINPADRTLQNLSYYFDWSVWEIFITLTSGACLVSVSNEILLNPETCINFMAKMGITVLHVTPSQYYYLLGVGRQLQTLKYLFLGAEKLPHDLARHSLASVNQDCRVLNMYGPTECTIIASTLEFTPSDLKNFKELSGIPIGVPVGNTELLVLDKYMSLCPVNVTGELYIGGDGVASGYLNNPELTAEKFVNLLATKDTKEHEEIKFFLTPNTNTLYRTGDLVRWLLDGNIEFLGRIDQQVKIRGFRIETGEIEKHLLETEEINEAVVIPVDVKDREKYLCAYIVTGKEINIFDLRQRLFACLPDYMIPSYIITLDRIPLSPNGKVDRKRLPVPELTAASDYAGPQDDVEERMVKIWSEVLGIEKEKIGVNTSFFELGGHSLKAVVAASRIHKEFNAKIPLAEIFRMPTIRGLAEYIRKSGAEQFVSIEPVEEKDFYPLSPAQKRLYILQHMQKNNLSYNIPGIVLLEGKFAKEKLEEAIRQLIDRHENLRTSFEMIEQLPIQRIHHDVDFAVEYDESSEEEAKPLIDTFVRPFDLAKVPLLRIRLVKIGAKKHLLMFDMHHIISDGTSMGIFVREFMALYEGKELTPLRIQYKDFSGWQNTRKNIEALKKQEEYWLREYEGDIPALNLPVDYERPAVQDNEGSSITFEIDAEETKFLKEMALAEGATLYMVLLAIFNVLLAKECDQEDIIIGVPTAGRRHADLEPLIGFFINTLALRSFPTGGKTFREFLLEVKEKTLKAYENQDFQLEELVNKVLINRESGRNSLIDVLFVFQNLVVLGSEIPEVTLPGLTLKPYELDVNTSIFDLVLIGYETGEKLSFLLQYRTKLFKKETAQMFVRNFKEVVSTVSNNKNLHLKDIAISHDLITLESVSLHEEEGDFGFLSG
jgi:amino acid adenylation domain-containing protein